MAPTGKESNWIKTIPGRGFFAMMRYYGPLDPALDGTWKLNDIEKMTKPINHQKETPMKTKRRQNLIAAALAAEERLNLAMLRQLPHVRTLKG